MVGLCIAAGMTGLAGLSGCAQSPAKPTLVHISANIGRGKLALDLKNRGELAEALIQWKILSTIEPSNAYYVMQIDSTKQLIDKKSKYFILEGVANLRQGMREAARLSFLNALALNPKNDEAFHHLQQLTIQYPSIGQNSGKPDGMCCMNHGVNTE